MGTASRRRVAGGRAFLAGAVPVLLLALLQALHVPLLANADLRAEDWLFRHGRLAPPAPGDAIVHVDIDDGALDTFGRWPWPRRLLADAIRGLDALGARVIALDLLLHDPQVQEYLPDGSSIDHDAELEAALREARARVVLAVETEEARFGSGEEWAPVRELLRRDITLDADSLVRAAGLEGERAALARGHLRALKGLVAQQTLAAQNVPDVQALEAVLVPPEGRELGDYPERRILEAAVDRAAALQALAGRLPRGGVSTPAREAESIRPPLRLFADAADGVGVVNATVDPDGRLRRAVWRWRCGDVIYPQLGLAAAAAYRGLPPAQLTDPQPPLAGAKRLLAWPRMDPQRPLQGLARHVSLGRVLAVQRAERALAGQAAAQALLTHALASAYLADSYRDDDLADPTRKALVERALRDELAFQLDGEGPETEETRAMRTWLRRDHELARGRSEVDRARGELRSAIAGRLVFVGWNATGGGDVFPTAAHDRTPGVVVHAVVADALLTGAHVREAPRWLGVLLAAALGLLAAGLAAGASRPHVALFGCVLLGAGHIAASAWFAFERLHVILPLVTPVFAVTLGWAGATLTVAVRERRARTRLERQFGARISKRLFAFLLDHPERIDLEGEERTVTCFFGDLVGFTSLSESLDSRTTVALLNRAMTALHSELTRAGAYVNKFLGDGIMAVWGAFGAEERDADHACRAALACRRRLAELNAQAVAEGLPPLDMRIGIATGRATVGDCGAPPDLRDYTVIGDPVNLAARLESANRQFGTRVLVDGATRERLGEDLVARPLGRFTVAGQSLPTELHELRDADGADTAVLHRLCARTAEAVARFREGAWEPAREAWSEVDAMEGGSPLARLYLDEIARRHGHPEEPFDGVVHLAAK